MKIEAEGIGQLLPIECNNEQLLRCLTGMMERREKKIQELRRKIEQYEKRRSQEQTAYQNMSPWRRWIAGRTPDQHRAVEYMVYIKQPMQEIERLLAARRYIEEMIEKITYGVEKLTVPGMFIHEVIEGCKEGEQQ
jgi:acetyl-CoA carboxylase alpha subunit